MDNTPAPPSLLIKIVGGMILLPIALTLMVASWAGCFKVGKVLVEWALG